MHRMVSPPDDDGYALPPGRPPIRDRRVLRVQWLDSVWACVPCPGSDLGPRLSDSRCVLLRGAPGLDRESGPAAACPLLRGPDRGRGVESPPLAIRPGRKVGPLGPAFVAPAEPK